MLSVDKTIPLVTGMNFLFVNDATLTPGPCSPGFCKVAQSLQ